MPNNITNQITFGSDNAALAAFQKMLHDMRMEDQPLGSIDFNKLLPMPKELDMEAGTRTDRGLKLVREYHQALTGLERQKPGLTPAEYALALRKCEGLYRKQRMADPVTWALGEQAYSNVQRFGSPTWYEWCNRNWGTKWNAYGFPPLEKDSDTMEFFTAWDSVPKIITLFLGYSELLNALDTGSTTKLTINNKRLNRQDFEQKILLPRQDDYLDGYRAEYNAMLMDKVTDSSNSVVQERYIKIVGYFQR